MKKSKKKTQAERIKAKIAELHERESGDYQSLLRQVRKKQKKIQLNLPQLVFALTNQPETYLEWGRGTGKTTALGQRVTNLVGQMPRSTGLFIGPSYQYILTRIIPSFVQGLEMFGLYENLHYFIGRQPPVRWRKAWPSAFQPPKRHDKYITFFNGTGIHLISHDVKGDGRGLNTDWIIGDEAALLAKNKLQENTDPTLRGTNVHAFRKQSLFGSKLYVSSTPLTPGGEWFVNQEEIAVKHPDKVAFISATCEHNKHNLREGYLEDAERNAYAKWVYLAEYKNVRPTFSKGGFYGLLSDEHWYSNYDYQYYVKVGQEADCRGDADLVKGVPLILGMDFGAAINCLTISQYLKSINEHRCIKSMYVLGSDQKIQDDLIQEFCDYYCHHDAKTVELWYDNTGNNKTGNTKKTRAEQAAGILRKNGWTVSLMTKGNTNPEHAKKHMLWEAIFREDNPQLPAFRMNQYNCKELKISMVNAKTKQGRNGEVKKDKSSEQSKTILRQHATDLSDAMDAVMYGRYYDVFRFGQASIPAGY
jgi:hypothetical protein